MEPASGGLPLTETPTGRRIALSGGGEVGALLTGPGRPRALLALAHGAGAGMRHPFLEDLARRLAAHDVATLRYQFPYMEAGRRRPDPASRLIDAVRAAVETAREAAGDAPLFAGGKSMGGRMTTLAAAERPLPGVRGLVLVGFPLHPAGRPDTGRAEHLRGVDRPLLFLQGTRDRLADLALLRPELERLGARATLHVLEDADHSFRMPKRSGRTDEEAREELARVAAEWMGRQEVT